MRSKNRSKLFTMVFGITCGISIGLIMSLIFSYCFGRSYYPSTAEFTNQFSNPLNAVTVSIIIWGLMGIVFSLGSLVFSQEQWGITKQTIIHFSITYVGYTGLALICRWFPLNITWLVIYTFIFILIYLVIWGVKFMIARRYVRMINHQINLRK